MAKMRDLAPVALIVALSALIGAPARAAPPVTLAQIYLDDLGEEPADEAAPADETGDPDQVPKPDLKQNEDGSGPPRSAEDTKGDKLDLELELGQVPDKPLDRPKLLAELYEQLGLAKSAYEAKPIMQAIEELWTLSGSDTVDLLMSRAVQFAETDIELSLAILDAVVDIAPDKAEPWQQRARVHILRGDYERALADLRRALNLDPKHYWAINDLGLVLEQIGAKKEALAAYRKALAVNPFLDETRRTVEQLAREVEGQDI